MLKRLNMNWRNNKLKHCIFNKIKNKICFQTQQNQIKAKNQDIRKKYNKNKQKINKLQENKIQTKKRKNYKTTHSPKKYKTTHSPKKYKTT
jgi:hypothetical protein